MVRSLLLPLTLVLASGARAHIADPVPAMDRFLAATYHADAPGAATIVVRNGKVVLRRGYGMANLELHVPMRPEMVFRLCSLTKQFTAMAILMLVEEGKLTLDQDVRMILPSYRAGGRKITIEQLLTHTSGVKDYLETLWPARMREDVRPAKLIELFNAEELEFEPGTKASYSNANYILLGAVIEKISGKTYGQFLAERIFTPLHMTHSCVEEPQDLIAGRVSGYRKVDGQFFNAPYVSTVPLFAAGAVTSSVDDLVLWDAAIDSGKLLQRASWNRLFSPYKLSNGELAPYASGWVIGLMDGRMTASHAGGLPGFRTYALRIPDDHLYIAVLSNDETAEAQPEYVGRRLAALALGIPIADDATVHLDATVLDALTGQYRESAEETLTIRREGTRLLGQDTGNPEFELFPLSADAFVVKAFDARITFVRNNKGEVTGLVYQMGGQEIRIDRIR